MKKYYLRRLKIKAELGTKRRLNIVFVLRGIFIFAIVLFVMAFTIYLAVYNGYQNKLIQNVDLIPAEYKNATVILDIYNENDNLLLAFLDKGYEARKLTSATIYTFSTREIEDLKSILKKFPLNKVDFKLEVTDLFEICSDIFAKSSDQKTVIIANPDISVRTATICNNSGVLALPATIEDPDYLVFTTSINTRINELSKIVFEQLEKK